MVRVTQVCVVVDMKCPVVPQMLSNMKQQFAELLQDIGFVQTRNPSNPQCNKNSGEIPCTLFKLFLAFVFLILA